MAGQRREETAVPASTSPKIWRQQRWQGGAAQGQHHSFSKFHQGANPGPPRIRDHGDQSRTALQARPVQPPTAPVPTNQEQQREIPTQQVETAKAKKPRPPLCHRCKTSGHMAQVCKADLDCYICNKKDSHLATKCPVLKLPKPTCSLFGFGKTEFGFLQIN